MGYKYEEHRPRVFTEEGQVMFLKIRDNAKHLLSLAGAVQSGKLMSGVSGDSWTMLACIDRLVELGELREVTKDTWGQHRVFVDPKVVP
jgi:hypothetical protein